MPLSKTSFDNSDFFLYTLGTWWSSFFGDSVTVKEMMAGTGELYTQTYMDLLETIALLSKFTVPVFHKKNWHAFTVRASEQFNGSQLNRVYGEDGFKYVNALIPAYGEKEATNYFSYSLPAAVQGVHAIYNRILDPSLVLLNNQDYFIDTDRHALHLLSDPFEDELVPKRDVIDDDGNVVDQEILLWFNMSDWDSEFIYRRFGYAIKIWMESSTFYKEFVSAIWDHLTIGPTKAALKLALSALSGVRFAVTNETVIRIVHDGDNILVETETNLYTYKNTVTLLVEVGDTLAPGDPLCDAVLVIEPHMSTDWSGFVGVSLNANMLRLGDIKNAITFKNTDVPVEYIGVDPNGKTVVQFNVNGFDEDIDTFWRQAHNEGLLLDNTMAELLDTRANPVGQPLPQDLPSTINPFQFIMSNLFSSNVFVIVLKPEQFAAGAPGLQGMEYMYKYMVPQSTYLIFVEMQQGTDYYSVGESDDELLLSKAVPTTTDVLTEIAHDHGPTIKTIRENCR